MHPVENTEDTPVIESRKRLNITVFPEDGAIFYEVTVVDEKHYQDGFSEGIAESHDGDADTWEDAWVGVAIIVGDILLRGKM